MKVCIATGSRSEYGVLEPLIKRIDEDPDLELALLVSGAHLSSEFGHTANQIDYPYTPVEMLLSSDTPVGTAKSMGVGMISFADVLERMRPGLVIIEGDRFEMMAVATAAYTLRIPIAHISGGDVTEGSLDDVYRDCITRMATLHFTDTELAHRRVCQIRGQTNWVHYHGCLSLEDLKRKIHEPFPDQVNVCSGCIDPKTDVDWLQEIKLSEDYSSPPPKKQGVILSIHPSTDPYGQQIDMSFLWKIIKLLAGFTPVYATTMNADAGARVLEQYLYYCERHFFMILPPNTPRGFFLGVVSECRAIIGNSSAGIVEAPALGTATINIGSRQQGRPRASSIIDCEPTEEGIRAAIEKLNSKEFQDSLANIRLAYEGGNVAERIVETIHAWTEVK